MSGRSTPPGNRSHYTPSWPQSHANVENPISSVENETRIARFTAHHVVVHILNVGDFYIATYRYHINKNGSFEVFGTPISNPGRPRFNYLSEYRIFWLVLLCTDDSLNALSIPAFLFQHYNIVSSAKF